MPFLSGFDVVKELHDIRPDLPVAVTSGRSDEGTHAFAYSLGIKTWISKPTTIDELSHTEALVAECRTIGRIDRAGSWRGQKFIGIDDDPQLGPADINGRVIAGAQPFGNFRRVIEEELKK